MADGFGDGVEIKKASKGGDLSEAMRIAARMLAMPPQKHEPIGKGNASPKPKPKPKRTAGKGRARIGKPKA